MAKQIEYAIGSVYGLGQTKTEARGFAEAKAAKVIAAVEECPMPFVGLGEIVAVSFAPSNRGECFIHLLHKDRVATYVNSIEGARYWAIGFVAQYGISARTTVEDLDSLEDWVADKLDRGQALVLRQAWRQIIIDSKISKAAIAHGYTPTEAYAIMCNATTLTADQRAFRDHVDTTIQRRSA